MKGRVSALIQICDQFGLAALYAFGSQAQRVREWLEECQDSFIFDPADVDIAVRVISEKQWSVTDKVSLTIALEELFGCKRVDLVSLIEVDPFLAVEAIRGERLFARDEYEADEYELYVLRRAGDLSPLERDRMALILEEST